MTRSDAFDLAFRAGQFALGDPRSPGQSLGVSPSPFSHSIFYALLVNPRVSPVDSCILQISLMQLLERVNLHPLQATSLIGIATILGMRNDHNTSMMSTFVNRSSGAD